MHLLGQLLKPSFRPNSEEQKYTQTCLMNNRIINVCMCLCVHVCEVFQSPTHLTLSIVKLIIAGKLLLAGPDTFYFRAGCKPCVLWSNLWLCIFTIFSGICLCVPCMRVCSDDCVTHLPFSISSLLNTCTFLLEQYSKGN